MIVPGLALLVATLCLAATSARSEEGRPLTLTVHPSGYEAPRESLDDKLARRLREDSFLFRSICRGCGRHEALLEPAERPFEPQASLARSRQR